MKTICNFELQKDRSITSTGFDLMPNYTPLNNNQRTEGIIFYKTEEEIKELKILKVYKRKDEEWRISSIPMDCKTDQAILLALLSQNKEEFSISIKDLAIQIGVNKRVATSKKVKERIMNSINKHRCFEFTKLKEGIFHCGFNILSYEFDVPQKNHLKIYFDKQFLNLYHSNNKSIINLDDYLELKNEYSKLLYSMLNNYFNNEDREVTIFPEVLRKKLNNIDSEGKTVAIDAQKRQKINKALAELKEKKIIKSYRFNKNDSIVFRPNEKIIEKPKKINMEKKEMKLKDKYDTMEEKMADIKSQLISDEGYSIEDKIKELNIKLKESKSVMQTHVIKEELKELEKQQNNYTVNNSIKKEELLNEEITETKEEDFFNQEITEEEMASFEDIIEANRTKKIMLIKK